MAITHIVLTGGPCAGKTTMLSRMVSEFSDRGYKVLVVPETATEIILEGIIPGAFNISMEYFQHFIIEKQLHKEELTIEAARAMRQDKTLIVYDRGLMDGQAYVDSKETFDSCLKLSDLNRVDVLARYDAVIHLVTAANGAESAYTKANNAARRESVYEASEADDKTLAAWVGHSHLRVIDNSTGFEEKVQRAMKEVYAVLGEPVPVEIERKFLIKKPLFECLESCGAVQSTIVQTYLVSDSGQERRVRQRGDGEAFTFYYTEKQDISGIERIEKEKKITEREYLSLLAETDPMTPTLVKVRYCFVWEGKYFELDTYQGDSEYALLEIELTDKSENFNLPPFISVVKEVTEDPSYRNHEIAKRHGKL